MAPFNSFTTVAHLKYFNLWSSHAVIPLAELAVELNCCYADIVDGIYYISCRRLRT